MIKNFFCFLFLFFSLYSTGAESSGRELIQAQKLWKSLPIQHQGRVKPFDTFSREILRTVYGKEKYKHRLAVEVILSWLIIPDFWENTKFIFIESKDIKESLALPLKEKYFSPSELRGNTKLILQLADLNSLKQSEERLDTYLKDLEKLETKIVLYSAIKSGYLIRLEPSEKSATWKALPDISQKAEDQFKKTLSSYVSLISENMFSNLADEQSAKDFAKMRFNNKKEDSKNKLQTKQDTLSAFETFKTEMITLQNILSEKAENIPYSKIRAEIFYNHFKPFQKAWIFYLLFLISFIAIVILARPHLLKWITSLAMIGFTLHSLGMLLRSYIMSRPPVSNMYETVIWVPWVALIAGFVFYLRGMKLPFVASVILSFFCLLLTSLAPDILDGSLQPLEAVLNSSFWLTTHVLVITMSYSFFFLAFVLGDMALISYLTKRSDSLALIKKMYHPIYRSLQWGVVLLAGGTILGGIWADYSWGRFWGWDPKESWALVSLLAYLALLHGKLLGWIKPFGMAVGAVMMFFSVIMAWYGVNFILGAGLHSYGFGTGGVEYVSLFVVLHLILCGLAIYKKRKLI